ncbi:MAG: hypothetical protein PQ964_07225 [Methanobacteriaceae archaeon]
MNKKILALSILAVFIMVGGYAAFYAYSMYMALEDVRPFKEGLKAIETPIPETEIQKIETLANQIEGGPPLTLIPESERIRMANDMRNKLAPIKAKLNEFKQNTTYKVDLVEDMMKTLEEIPENFEKGDNVALAKNLRELARIRRKLHA